MPALRERDECHVRLERILIQTSDSEMARNLKVERAKRGWSQEDLAEASGVGQNSIARYEMGGTTPGLDQAFKIASALGCSTLRFRAIFSLL